MWPGVGPGGVGLGGATRLSSTLGARIPAKRAGFRCARGAHTFSLCSRNVTVWQVVSRHIQRRIVPPDPHRDPGPGRVDHLHHHTPVTLSKSPQPPSNTHSPTPNSEEPVWRSVLSNGKPRNSIRAMMVASLNAPFGARCFLTWAMTSPTVGTCVWGLNAPFGARCFLTPGVSCPL